MVLYTTVKTCTWRRLVQSCSAHSVKYYSHVLYPSSVHDVDHYFEVVHIVSVFESSAAVRAE